MYERFYSEDPGDFKMKRLAKSSEKFYEFLDY